MSRPATRTRGQATRTRGRATRTRGQAIAEFALIAPLFLLLFMALFDFGRVVYAHSVITQDARSAARFASASAPQADADIRERARSVSPGVPIPDSAIIGEGGSFYPEGTAEGRRVVVRIVIQVPIVTPIISNIVGGSFTLDVTGEDLVRS